MIRSSLRSLAFMALASLSLFLDWGSAQAQRIVGVIQQGDGTFILLRDPSARPFFSTLDTNGFTIVPNNRPADLLTVSTANNARVVPVPATPAVTYPTAATSTGLNFNTFTVPQMATTVVARPVTEATKAILEVNVPADAEVWIQDKKMTQSGTSRRFLTTSLDSGMAYSYDIRAAWMEDGRQVVREQKVVVQSGDWKSVSFPSAALP